MWHILHPPNTTRRKRSSTCNPWRTNSPKPIHRHCRQYISRGLPQNWPCTSRRMHLELWQHSPSFHPISWVCSAAMLARMRMTMSMASTRLACSLHWDSPWPLLRSARRTKTQSPEQLVGQFDEVQSLCTLLSPLLPPVKQQQQKKKIVGPRKYTQISFVTPSLLQYSGEEIKKIKFENQSANRPSPVGQELPLGRQSQERPC